MFARTFLIVSLLLVEVVLASLWLDTSSGRHGLIGFLDTWGSAAVRASLAALGVFGAVVSFKSRPVFPAVSRAIAAYPVSWSFLTLHVLALAVFGLLSRRLFSPGISDPGDLTVLAWMLAAVLVGLSCICSFVPVRSILVILASSGWAWAYAILAGVLAYAMGGIWQLARPLLDLTFQLVSWLLRPFLSDFIADPVARVIGTAKFSVVLYPQCSGLEGASLMLICGTIWLWLFRDQYRIRRAALAIPAGMLLLWLLNVVRIAALILIGNSGAGDVAARAFHSEAGWIAFSAVALALLVGMQHIPWLKRETALGLPQSAHVENPVAKYLVPLLAILAAGMLSRATSGALEWLYPLRFCAAVASLLYFRSMYLGLDWRFGGASVFAGAVVFGIWISMDWLLPSPAGNGLQSALFAMPPMLRIAWIAIRVLAAVLTVPIAEELAFRGFLLRRLVSRRFESVDFRKVTLFSVVVSSLAFGLLHGSRWAAGAIAGAIYALILGRRGRMGDAVAAHATTNALLAIWVLLGNNWNLW